jgi:single-stranded DNA-binding protein
MKVTVSGAIKMSEYVSKDGSIKQQLKLNVNEIELPPKGSLDEPVSVQSTVTPIVRQPSPSANTARAAAYTADPSRATAKASGDPFAKLDDDIPF